MQWWSGGKVLLLNWFRTAQVCSSRPQRVLFHSCVSTCPSPTCVSLSHPQSPSRTSSAVHDPTPVCKTRAECSREQQVPLCVPLCSRSKPLKAAPAKHQLPPLTALASSRGRGRKGGGLLLCQANLTLFTP